MSNWQFRKNENVLFLKFYYCLLQYLLGNLLMLYTFGQLA